MGPGNRGAYPGKAYYVWVPEKRGAGMKGRDQLFSKKSDEWETPKWLFDQLNEEFHFNFDGACNYENCLCEHGNVIQDGIKVSWYPTWDKIYINPPYSKIAAFMEKAYIESQKGAVVVCLIPVRSDTRYWHDYVMKAAEIRIIRGRLKFINPALPSWDPEGNFKVSPAPFPSCVVIFWQKEPEAINDPPVIGPTIEQPKKVKVA